MKKLINVRMILVLEEKMGRQLTDKEIELAGYSYSNGYVDGCCDTRERFGIDEEK